MMNLRHILSRPSNQRRSGFTLTEIMVATAIVGVLSATAIPTYSKFFKRAKIAEVYLGLSQIYSVETAHFTIEETYSANLSRLLGKNTAFLDANSSVAIYGFNPSIAGNDPYCTGPWNQCVTTIGMTTPTYVNDTSIKYTKACIKNQLQSCTSLKPTYNPRMGPPLSSDFTNGSAVHFEVNAVLDLENDGKLDVYGISDKSKTVSLLCVDGTPDPVNGVGMGGACN